MPPSPCLPRHAGSPQPGHPRPGSAGSSGSGSASGSSPPASTGGARPYPLPGTVVAAGRRSGNSSVDNPLWAPPASAGRLSSRSLVGGWTATDNPLSSADGSEQGRCSSGQGPLASPVSGASSGSSRRLARAEGARGSGSLASLAEGSPTAGRTLVRGNTWGAGAAPAGALARNASGASPPSTPYSPAANRSLPRTLSTGSMGSGRPLMRSVGSMGSGDLLPERSGPSGGSSSLAGSSGGKFAQPRGKYVPAPAKAVKYAQPAGRTPASASTKSFNARSPPPKEPPQRQRSKLDRLLSQGPGQAPQAGSAAASGSAPAPAPEGAASASAGGSQ